MVSNDWMNAIESRLRMMTDDDGGEWWWQVMKIEWMIVNKDGEWKRIIMMEWWQMMMTMNDWGGQRMKVFDDWIRIENDGRELWWWMMMTDDNTGGEWWRRMMYEDGEWWLLNDDCWMVIAEWCHRMMT